MSNVIRIDKHTGHRWAIDSLERYVGEGCRTICGFAFGCDPSDAATHAIMPDEVMLADLLMARAILDEYIGEIMSLQRRGRDPLP